MHRAWLWLWVVAAGWGLWGGGCKGLSDDPILIQRATTGPGAEGGGSGGADLSAEELFEQRVRPGLVENCAGADCHSSGTVAFLLAGQEYASITTYITTVGLPLIVDDPEQSQLITYPDNPEHTGIPWQGLEELRRAVLEWLTLEAGRVQPVSVLEVGPVVPNGFTVLSLGGLGADYAGVALTFYATRLGNPVTSMQLTDISVWPPPHRAVRVDDPTFVVRPPGGAELADVSMHAEPYVFVAPDSVVMGSGELILTDWTDGAELSVRFRGLSLLFADDDGTTFAPCTRVDLYREAVDALPIVNGTNQPNGLLYCADQCHGGSAGTQPTDVMDLSSLLLQDRDDAHACALTLPFITPTNPASSRLLQIVDPASADPHPFDFGGSAGAHAAFVAAMSPWIHDEGAAP